HVLQAGQHMTLHGLGREPIGASSGERGNVAREVTQYDAIDSPAITHRYDLVEANPAAPYLPKVVEGNGNPNGYVPLDPSVAQDDPETGEIVTGRGNHGRLYALAVLSVGDKAASFPLVFEPRRSYVPPRPNVIVAPPLPQIRVLG